jgi:FMN-dependent NADH-azoreductase
MNVLLLTTSPRGDASHSTQVASELARKVAGANHREAVNLTVRDLSRDSIPHIGPDFVHAAFTPEGDRTAAQRETLALSDQLIAELRAADVVVIGAGLINFGVPSTLKAWIDHVTRVGVTFRYSKLGPEGLLTGKRVVLIVATGGVYSSGPFQAMDHLEPYLRHALGFMGLTDIETIRIEGVAHGPEATEKALTQATERAEGIALALAA